jgi:hypothetical protein
VASLPAVILGLSRKPFEDRLIGDFVKSALPCWVWVLGQALKDVPLARPHWEPLFGATLPPWVWVPDQARDDVPKIRSRPVVLVAGSAGFG